jgi:hypothetical protein
MNNEHDPIAHITRQQAREALVNARAMLERAVREMDTYLDAFERAKDDGGRARVMNWAIGYLAANLHGNLRLDILADRQAELTQRMR